MHPEAYIKRYLWNCVVAYHNLSYEEYERTFLSKTTAYQRPTSKHWDIIHQCHYYVSNYWGTHPDNKLEDTAKMFSQSQWRDCDGKFRYNSHPWSPWYVAYKSRIHKFWWRGYREERTKYVRLPHHQKKVLSEHEEHKKNWKTKKKGKRHKSNHRRRHNPGRSWKEIEHRAMRRWVKGRLHQEDWDLEQGYKKRHTSPWDWD